MTTIQSFSLPQKDGTGGVLPGGIVGVLFIAIDDHRPCFQSDQAASN
jgi:hypothetical protein